jgi:hypothetical protein
MEDHDQPAPDDCQHRCDLADDDDYDCHAIDQVSQLMDKMLMSPFPRKEP